MTVLQQAKLLADNAAAMLRGAEALLAADARYGEKAADRVGAAALAAEDAADSVAGLIEHLG